MVTACLGKEQAFHKYKDTEEQDGGEREVTAENRIGDRRDWLKHEGEGRKNLNAQFSKYGVQGFCVRLTGLQDFEKG